MIFKSNIIKVPVEKRTPVIDDCFVLLKLPRNITINIPATFHCYIALERSFNYSYNFNKIDQKKPLCWFVNEYIKNKYDLNINIIISLLNDFLESFVEINEKFNVKDFKDNVQKQIVTDCIMILSAYCIGGSEEGKKLLENITLNGVVNLLKKKKKSPSITPYLSVNLNTLH